jgi:hypothetical protein
MAASPVRPAESVGDVVEGLDNECDEQALDLVAGQRDQPVRSGVAGVFVGADDGEEGMGGFVHVQQQRLLMGFSSGWSASGSWMFTRSSGSAVSLRRPS